MKIADRDIKGLLIDLDGVLYVSGQVIPGAIDFVDTLRARDVPHCFLTNTTTKSLTSLKKKLDHMGIPSTVDDILSAPAAARNYLHQKGLNRCLFLLNEEVLSEFYEFERGAANIDAVVIGDIGNAWTYDLLNQVFRAVMNGAELIALHRNKFWQTDRGLQMDIGAFVAGLEFATGRQATLIGKPAKAFFDAALQRIGLPAEHVAMVGDDVDTDIGAAQMLGLTGILVKTGKYREEYVRNSGVTPDLVIESIAHLNN